jgi:hypothetical protein
MLPFLKFYFVADGEVYAATVSDFSGADPLIYKDPLRTEQYDSKILNSKRFLQFYTVPKAMDDFIVNNEK